MEKETMLFAACVSPLEDYELYRAAYRAVPPERREKADRFRQKNDRLLSLGAGVLVKYALSRFGKKEYNIVYGVNGKPYIKGNDVFFNISHSGGYVLCAVSKNEVGCDIEKLDKADLRIAERFFAPEEYAFISSQAPEKQDEMFFRFWTLKESFMKFTGKGMALSPASFRIILDNGAHIEGNESCFLREFDIIPGYRCALCCAGDIGDTDLKMIDLHDILQTEVTE